MAYEHERDEWRRDVTRMTEVERQHAEDQPRLSLGIVGDIEDARN
jgi:hypothetical protein